MKKLLILLSIGLSMQCLTAQTVADAVRYSTQNLTGTARYRGAGGAFGALGGDVSAINSNPAGSAIFNNSTVALTLSSGAYDNHTFYNDGITSNKDSNIDLNQFGGVFVSNGIGKIRKFTFGFNYDRTNDFDNAYIASGVSSNSIADYFLGNAQGTPLDLLELQSGETNADLYQFLGENETFATQQAFLGYQGYLIDPVSSDLDNTEYVSAQNGNSFNQEYQYTTRGNNSKFTFNAAGQFSENLYLGLNLNAHTFNFTRNTVFYEDNSGANNAVSNLRFDNEYRAFGSGISAQLGGIYHISPSLRVGATYDTPTYFTISEETEQYLGTSGTNGDAILNPNTINIYEDYNLRTPGKATGSIAYIFGNLGFLSFDYSYQDYGSMKYSPDEDVFFQQMNNQINNQLKGVSCYKLGGEFLAGDWSFRGGYRFIESPYKNEETLGNTTGYSLGLGYTLGNARIDIAYDWAKQEQNAALYESAFTNTAFIDNINTNILATVSFQL